MRLYEEFAECGPLQGFTRQYIFLPLLVMTLKQLISVPGFPRFPKPR
jgi:hypothetical protein